MQKFAILLALIAVSGCSTADSGTESFGSKSDWSALQGLEYENRNKTLAAPVRKTVGDSKILGVPSSDGKKIIWILLNPQASPFYKQMPHGNYSISQSQFDEITHDKSASPTVLEVLASHIAE